MKASCALGYDLHITRATHWAENKGNEITKNEWLLLVAEDPELSLDPTNGDDFANWNGKSDYPEPWFRWRRGNISTKNPDRVMIAKMTRMAKILNAQVQGDDGELYEPPID